MNHRKGEPVMQNFILKEINQDGYDRFLLCLSFDGLATCLNSIEASLELAHSSGKILIDQLLITGNNDNRFLSCDFSNGRLDFKTAHIVNPTCFFRKETVDWLHNNYGYVENSILTEAQRQKVKNGVAF